MTPEEKLDEVFAPIQNLGQTPTLSQSMNAMQEAVRILKFHLDEAFKQGVEFQKNKIAKARIDQQKNQN